MKPAYTGIFHRMIATHLQRYVDEIAARHNKRPHDTQIQMRIIVANIVGCRLIYRDLTRDQE